MHRLLSCLLGLLLLSLSSSVSSSAVSSSADFPVDLFLQSSPFSPEDGCSLCKSLTGWIGPYLASNSTLDKLARIGEPLCELFIDSVHHGLCTDRAACKQLCMGLIPEYLQIGTYVIANSLFAPATLCHILKACPAPPSFPQFPPGLPIKANLSDFSGQKMWPNWKLTQGTGYFLHLTDIHLDLWYSTGSPTNCAFALCCRADAPAQNSSDPGSARPFGEYNCDTSEALLDSILTHISSLNPPPDFILYTGDSPAHDVWAQTLERNLLSMNTVCARINKAFPAIPVFQAIGNHESYPEDQFDQPENPNSLPFTRSIYTALQRDWAYYLPDEAIRTLAYGGFYQALVRPGLRVISFNGNYYAAPNLFLDFNNTDMTRQMNWFQDTLESISQRGLEKVIIIGHTRPWDWKSNYTRRYNQLITQYSHLILNQFYGHSHTAGIALFNDDQGNPINTAFIGGSVTTYTYLNPGYRIYQYDRANLAQQAYLVQDYQDYWSPLDLTNQRNGTILDSPHIIATRDFNIPDLSPKSVKAFADAVLTNSSTFKAYTQGKYKGVAYRDHDTPQTVHCDVSYSYPQQRQQCYKQNAVEQAILDKLNIELC